MARCDVRIIIESPPAQAGEGIVVAETWSIGRMALVARQSRVEAEERHGGGCAGADSGGGGEVLFFAIEGDVANDGASNSDV